MLEGLGDKVISEYGLAMAFLLAAVAWLARSNATLKKELRQETAEHTARYIELLDRTITTMEQGRHTIERLAERLR